MRPFFWLTVVVSGLSDACKASSVWLIRTELFARHPASRWEGISMRMQKSPPLISGRAIWKIVMAALGATAALSASTAASGNERMSTWVLRRLSGSTVRQSSPEAATVVFGQGHRLVGTSSCSSFIGDRLTWFAEPGERKGHFVIDPDSPAIWTTIACNDAAAAKIGQSFWTKMDRARRWSIVKRNLVITFADGSTATLDRSP